MENLMSAKLITADNETVFETSTSSPHHRTYFLRTPIKGTFFWDAGPAFHSINNAGGKFIEELIKVSGIQGFYLHDGYEVKVHKAVTWSWEEIHPHIASLIADHNDTAAWPAYNLEESSKTHNPDSEYEAN